MCQMLLLVLVHFLGDVGRILPILRHLLFIVEKLALETRVGVDNAAFRLDVAHGLEETPVFLMHQVCYDACGRARLARVTVTRKVIIMIIRVYGNSRNSCRELSSIDNQYTHQQQLTSGRRRCRLSSQHL